MKLIKKFDIGSNVFFMNKFDDYIPKDYDILYLFDEWIINDTNVLNRKRGGNDVFYFKNMSLDEFIDDTLNCKTPMRVGKFIVPEFAEYLNMTISDLKKLKTMFDRLDDKHKYERLIYESYINNNSFTLTEKQLQEAYDEYRKYR